jgi:hypothetical protein
VDKRLFIQGINFVPSEKQIHGKLRAVRLDVSPEILNMATDEPGTSTWRKRKG